MKTKREHKPEPSITGLMSCSQGHDWNVVDLNPERKTTPCPVCGTETSIRQGLKK